MDLICVRVGPIVREQVDFEGWSEARASELCDERHGEVPIEHVFSLVGVEVDNLTWLVPAPC